METLHFLHIAKNAGTSFMRLLKEKETSEALGIQGHRHWEDPEMFKGRSLIVLRDPVKRFISAYKYFKGIYPKKALNKPWVSRDINEFILKLKDGDPIVTGSIANPRHRVGKVRMGCDWVFYPQSAWVRDPAFVLRHETLNEDLDALSEITGRPKIELGVFNATRRESIDLTKKCESIVKAWYSEDYKILEKYEPLQLSLK